MEFDWDPEVDTPATVAVVGGGPLGVEAALYARFLGYFVMLFDQHKLGDHWLAWGDAAMRAADGQPATWCDVTSSLGLAALEAQSGEAAVPDPTAPVSCRQYVNDYLLPVARTDLLYESTHIHSRVTSISRCRCSLDDQASPATRAEREFRLLIDAANRGEYSQLADVVLDCSGRPARRGLASGGGLAVGEIACRPHMHDGKRDVIGKHRRWFAGQHCVLFGNDVSACANAVELSELAAQVAGTRVSWVVPKRRGGSWQLAPELAAAGYATLREQAAALLAGDHPAVVPIAAWGIESIRCDAQGAASAAAGESAQAWQIKLQTTAEETLDLQADCFVNCSTRCRSGAHRHELLVGPAERGLTAEPHYYVLGQAAAPDQPLTIRDGLQQIREAFGWIGGRAELDLYATVKPQSHRG